MIVGSLTHRSLQPPPLAGFFVGAISSYRPSALGWDPPRPSAPVRNRSWQPGLAPAALMEPPQNTLPAQARARPVRSPPRLRCPRIPSGLRSAPLGSRHGLRELEHEPKRCTARLQAIPWPQRVQAQNLLAQAEGALHRPAGWSWPAGSRPPGSKQPSSWRRSRPEAMARERQAATAERQNSELALLRRSALLSARVQLDPTASNLARWKTFLALIREPLPPEEGSV